MPPKKKKKCEVVQQSVKDLILKKKAKNITEEQEVHYTETSIELPAFLTEYNDISPVELTPENRAGDKLYHCSKLARVWFSDHSNIDEIVKEIWEKSSTKIHPIESYMSSCIRAVTSAPLRKHQSPYNRFRFDSYTSEIISRSILTNPQLKNQADLDAFIQFQNKHQLKLCEISFYVDNEAHLEAKKFVAEQQLKLKTDKIPPIVKSQLYWRIQRNYYESQNIVTNIRIDEITLADLERISNFKRFTLKLMELRNVPESSYKHFASASFIALRTIPGHSIIYSSLLVDARYNLICNIMTDEQQNEVADNYRLFYDQTNAGKIHKHLRDGTTRQQFHEMYQSLDNFSRKLPPFHFLFFQKIDDNNENEDSQTNVIKPFDPTATTSKSIETKKINYRPGPKSKKHLLRINNGSKSSGDDFLQRPQTTVMDQPKKSLADQQGDDSSSETSRDTVVPRSSSSAISMPEKFFIDPNPSPDEVVFMKIVIQDKRFVFQVKTRLKRIYSKDFDLLWAKHKALILMNFVHNYWNGDLEQLKPLLDKLGEGKDRALEIIASRKNPTFREGKKKCFLLQCIRFSSIFYRRN